MSVLQRLIDPSRFRSPLRPPAVSLAGLDSQRWIVPALIFVAVFVPNLPYMFVDMLWHDDAQWYFRATEGTVLDLQWRGKVTILSPYLDVLYAHGMVGLGVPGIRGVYVLVMALGSALLFFLYRDVLGFDWKFAAFVAIVPNILPSLRGIPVGLNASYALWGLTPVVAALLLLWRALESRSRKSPLLLILAFGFYFLGLNLPGAPSANFLVPNVCLLLVMLVCAYRRRAVLYGLPFFAYGVWKIYVQFLYTHRSPTAMPLELIVERVEQFLEMSSFLPFNAPYSIYVTIPLMVLGTLALVANSPVLFSVPRHFVSISRGYGILLLGWTALWMLSNSFAYIAASAEFRAHDYAYVFNFGAAILQTAGLVAVVTMLSRAARLSTSGTRRVCAGVLVAALVYVGVQRIHYVDHSWGWKPHFVHTAKSLRVSLSSKYIPQGSQVVVLGKNIGAFYARGIPEANSGYIRYLLRRQDLYALIGPDNFPANIFSPWAGWSVDMRGLNVRKPTTVFRWVAGTLERVDLLLTVEAIARNELPRLRWTLYDVGNNEVSPREISSGLGMDSYTRFMSQELPSRFVHTDVAFAPRPDHDELIGPERAEQLAVKQGLIDTEQPVGNHFTLRNVLLDSDPNSTRLKLVVRVDERPPGAFRLAYVVDGTIHNFALWSYARTGDHLLITTPPVSRSQFETNGVQLGFTNAGGWPYVPMKIGARADAAMKITMR